MGIFDRLYYGKAGKRDYSEMDMPKTRLSLFFLVLKDRLFDLIKVNFLQLLFWIPFMVWTFINVAAIQSLGAEEAPTPEALSAMRSYLFMWLVGLVPCIAITGPSSAGAAYVMRNWARDQHAYLWSDFKDAFLHNWKQALPVSVLTSLVPLVAYTAIQYYGGQSRQNPILFIPLAIVFMAVLLFTLMLPLLYPMMIGYELSLGNIFRNAFLMASASLPKMILCRLITFVPVLGLALGLFLGSPAVLMVLSLYYVLFGFAFSRLVYASFANDLFDKYLNPRIEGAQVGQGLRPRDADELDEEDEEEEEEDGEDA